MYLETYIALAGIIATMTAVLLFIEKKESAKQQQNQVPDEN